MASRRPDGGYAPDALPMMSSPPEDDEGRSSPPPPRGLPSGAERDDAPPRRRSVAPAQAPAAAGPSAQDQLAKRTVRRLSKEVEAKDGEIMVSTPAAVPFFCPVRACMTMVPSPTTAQAMVNVLQARDAEIVGLHARLARIGELEAELSQVFDKVVAPPPPRALAHAPDAAALFD